MASKGQLGIGHGAGDRGMEAVSTETGPIDSGMDGFFCSFIA